MSAYSDWKCGALSDSEYSNYCNQEARRDEYYENKKFDEAFCDDYDDGDDE